MKYMSRPTRAAVKDIDIDIDNILGRKYRYRVDIGDGYIDPSLLQTTDSMEETAERWNGELHDVNGRVSSKMKKCSYRDPDYAPSRCLQGTAGCNHPTSAVNLADTLEPTSSGCVWPAYIHSATSDQEVRIGL